MTARLLPSASALCENATGRPRRFVGRPESTGFLGQPTIRLSTHLGTMNLLDVALARRLSYLQPRGRRSSPAPALAARRSSSQTARTRCLS